MPSVTVAISLSRTGCAVPVGDDQGSVLLRLEKLVGIVQDPAVHSIFQHFL